MSTIPTARLRQQLLRSAALSVRVAAAATFCLSVGCLAVRAAPPAQAVPPAAPAVAPAPAGSLTPAPGTPGALVPQPEGPVPAGKVWSPEHGHWHDVPGVAPQGSAAGPLTITPQPGVPTVITPMPTASVAAPQPEGPVPPGKVWSPEHGHWHDVPGALPQGSAAGPLTITPQPGMPTVITPMPATGGLVPQPEGPVPAGKVWSPEHGHWHDAPPTVTPVPAPAPTPPKN